MTGKDAGKVNFLGAIIVVKGYTYIPRGRKQFGLDDPTEYRASKYY